MLVIISMYAQPIYRNKLYTLPSQIATTTNTKTHNNIFR